MSESSKKAGKSAEAVAFTVIPTIDLETDPERALLLDAKKGLTSEEARILADMRVLRDEALSVKARIRQLESGMEEARSSEERAGLKEQLQRETDTLETMRGRWKILSKARDEARHRRMVILGHEEE